MPEGPLPSGGVAAHRGGTAGAPENTLRAFRSAVALGAQMVELDLRRSRDGEVVVVHDETVDRTTNGTGTVADQTLAELQQWDAGQGEQIPTLQQALEVFPRDIWLNLQIKRAEPIASEVALAVAQAKRLHQCLVACGNAAARDARATEPEILLCNLVRQESRAAYLQHAIATGSQFIQFHHLRGLPEPEIVARAQRARLRVIHFCTPAAKELSAVYGAGVDFALVDDVSAALRLKATWGN